MPFPPTTILIAGVIILLSAVAQSAVGFGYALYATALLVWLGIPLPNVIALVGTCSMLQSAIGARRLRAHVPWRLALAATGIRLASVVVGLLLLKKLAGLDPNAVRMVVGGVLCLIVVVQLLWRPRPAERVHPGWAGLSFATSGLMAGFLGMGGPPLVIWLMAHNWPSQKTRGFLFSVFALAIPFQLTFMSLAFGVTILRTVVIGIACLPLVYAGSRVGMPIGDRMARGTLRAWAYAILLVIGISSIIPAILSR